MNLPDYTNCTLCPRMCHVNRSVTTGYCGCSSHISAARAALHKWEEPVLSGPEEEPGGREDGIGGRCRTKRRSTGKTACRNEETQKETCGSAAV